MSWTDLAQDRGRLQALVTAVTNLPVSIKGGIFSTLC